MKKSNILNIFSWLCAVLLFTNCGGDSASEGPTLSVNPTSVTLKANGTATVQVSSNTRWDVSTGGANWLRCSPSGDTGSKEVLISITTPNTTGGSREAILTFTDRTGEKSVTVSVKEEASSLPSDPDKIEVSPTSLSFENGGGSLTFTVSTNVSSWTAKSGDESWCTVSRSNNIVTVNVVANPNTSVRNTTITVSGGSATPQIVTVTQAAKEESSPLFEEPYIVWGSTVSSVKSFMSGYDVGNDGNLLESNGNYVLWYYGKNKVNEIDYYFTSSTSGLVYSLVFFDSQKVSKEEIISAFKDKDYTYNTTEDNITYYQTKDGSSYVALLLNNQNLWVVYYFSTTQSNIPGENDNPLPQYARRR